MTKRTEIEHPFKVLEINICDDQTVVEDGYQSVIKKYKRFENSPNPQERARYKTLFIAYKELKDPQKRKEIIADYTAKLHKDIEIFLSGKTMIEETALEELIKIEVERWGFDPGLAGTEIQQALVKKGIKVGKEIIKEPLLVSNAVITAEKNSITLSWHLPPHNCDEILIIRRDDRCPQHATDGKEVFRGMATGYRDNDISPGKYHCYAIFTLYEGKISKHPIELKECVISPVTHVNIKTNCTEIFLQWEAPGMTGRTVITRDTHKPPAVTAAGNSLQINSGQKVFDGPGTAYTDTHLTPETEYYYSLIAVFPGDRYAGEVVVSGKTPGLPGVPANFSVQEKENGVLLRWQTAKNAEGYHLVRKEHTPPAHENDGSIIYHNGALEYEDTPLTNGVAYFYALYSYMGNIFSEKSAHQVFLLKKPPYGVSVETREDCIKIAWLLPPGAVGVVVRRSGTQPPANVNDGSPIPLKDNQSLEDRNVTLGKTYHYTLFSLYTYGGTSEYSSGRTAANLVPAAPPAPVENIRLSWEGDIIRILWDRPAREDKNNSIVGICIAYSKNSFAGKKGQRMKFSTIKKYVVGWADLPLSFDHTAPPSGQIGYYAVFTAATRGQGREISDFEVTFSGEIMLDLLADVKKLETRKLPDRGIRMQWDWPEGCEVVYIARSHSTPPAKIEFTGNRFLVVDDRGEYIEDGVVLSVPKKMYQIEKSYTDEEPGPPPVYYRLCTASPSQGNMRFSPGKEINLKSK